MALWALEMKSDDVSILLGLASLFALLARCIEDQLHDSQTMATMRAVEGFDIKYFRHRAHRFRQSADRQYQEALRIDPTRADLLASYACYLLTFPERRAEASKYLTRAVWANPYNEELQAKLQELRDGRYKGSLNYVPRASRNYPLKPSHNEAFQHNEPGGKKRGILKRRAASVRQQGWPKARPQSYDIIISSPKTMNRELVVVLISCTGLKAKTDTYCTLQLGHQVHRSLTKKKSSTPAWNEPFVFSVTNAQEALTLRVFESGRFSLVNNLVGVRVLPISEIEAMSGRIGWYVLCPSEGEPSNLSLGQVGLHFNISNA